MLDILAIATQSTSLWSNRIIDEHAIGVLFGIYVNPDGSLDVYPVSLSYKMPGRKFQLAVRIDS